MQRKVALSWIRVKSMKSSVFKRARISTIPAVWNPSFDLCSALPAKLATGVRNSKTPPSSGMHMLRMLHKVPGVWTAWRFTAAWPGRGLGGVGPLMERVHMCPLYYDLVINEMAVVLALFRYTIYVGHHCCEARISLAYDKQYLPIIIGDGPISFSTTAQLSVAPTLGEAILSSWELCNESRRAVAHGPSY